MSALSDLRTYWTLRRKPCRNEQRRPGMHPAELGYQCTLPTGHNGRHVAHDLDGTLITTWPAVGVATS